jgi:hypothetical protein
MLASDDANQQFVGARNPDDILHVTFYVKVMKNNFASEQEGRPIFQNEQWVRIMIPGNNLSIIDTPVSDRHKHRFPRQWQQFTNSQEVSPVSGTPVTEWPAVERSRAEELKAMKFFTVEQIAECSDQQIQALGMDAHTLRQKAKAFLAKAGASALTQAQAVEIEELKKAQAAKDAAHALEMAELRKLIEDRAPAKRGRPPKQEQVSG